MLHITQEGEKAPKLRFNLPKDGSEQLKSTIKSLLPLKEMKYGGDLIAVGDHYFFRDTNSFFYLLLSLIPLIDLPVASSRPRYSSRYYAHR